MFRIIHYVICYMSYVACFARQVIYNILIWIITYIIGDVLYIIYSILCNLCKRLDFCVVLCIPIF